MLKISVVNPHWPSQALFIKRVKEFAMAKGHVTPRGAVRIPVLADLFNMSESTLRQSLHYKAKRRLGYDTLVFIAGVIGCSVNELTGAPSATPPLGISQKQWASAPESDRLFATQVLEDIIEGTLTAQEKAVLFGAYSDLKKRLIRMRK